MDFVVMALKFLEAEVIKIFLPEIMQYLMFQGIREVWWTGGHDMTVEGEWKWITSCQPVEDFVWSADHNEPDGSGGHDCLDLSYDREYSGSDYLCDSTYYPICQIKQ